MNLLEGQQPTKVSKQGEASRIYVHFPIDVDDNNLQEILTKNTGKPDTFYLDICPNAEEIEANLK